MPTPTPAITRPVMADPGRRGAGLAGPFRASQPSARAKPTVSRVPVALA